jgi:hypothetical protein
MTAFFDGEPARPTLYETAAATGCSERRLALTPTRVVFSAVPPTVPTLIDDSWVRSDGSGVMAPVTGSASQPCRYRPASFFR